MSSHKMMNDSTPICRCRVLYLGSAVPHVTKDGLQGIQEPLRELYPEQGALGARGIDSWLSVWSNGLLLENVDENHKKVTRFFPIDTLHYCAAVRYVLVPEKNSVSSSTQPRFLPLDSPFARSPNPSHPPLFAAILRRTMGIKVLECHTFICKREMAANALVRCCFHAYADSSYARHIDSGGNASSVYGTLRNYNQPIMSSNSIEKVEGWRRMATQPATSGSTLTLNSTLQANIHQNGGDTLGSNPDNSNSVDDISIYNGDENHKIWAGSTRDISTTDREGNYGEYGGSTMRSTRSMRPRQVINAPPPPPPPLKEEKGKKPNKDKSKRKKGGSKEEMYPMMNGSLIRTGHSQAGLRSQSSMSGTMMKGGTMGYPNHIYSNGTILRPVSSQVMNGYPPPPPPPPVLMVPTTLPHPRRMVAGTYSHRPTKSGALVLPPRPHILPPNFVPMPPHPMYMQSGRKVSKHWPVAMEEPIYMPSTRPLSPVASYQPGHFPHEAYLMQQYATMDVKAKKKGKDNKNKKSIPILVNGERMDDDDDPESPFDAEIYRRKVKEGKQSKKGSSQNGDHRPDEDDESPFNTGMYRRKAKGTKNGKKKEANGDQEDDDDNESPFNTGIYRRKGHLNERAFSYSIRQEHRSRSYGSLANLKFAPPPIVPNGGGPPGDGAYYGGSVNKEEMKKEREIIQMMQDLELSGDELERSEVPPAVYQQARQRPTKVRR
uniref:PID domain-containing protein n=1 Tax=Graphocephala atropunctata TaxID=36148 RepID=A0A1B6MHK3_9HEMI